MAERGIAIYHSMVHRWFLHFGLVLLERFNREKLQATRKWNGFVAKFWADEVRLIFSRTYAASSAKA